MALGSDSVTSVTGTEVDDKFAAQIIGKDIPVFVGGQALIGCRIAEGPFLRTEGSAGFCDMIVTAALSATPGATRTITSLNLNGTKSWTLAGGFIGPAFSGMEIDFLYGTEEQVPLDSSVERFGSKAVPYRSHICIELRNIPLDVFANTIPFVSIFVDEEENLPRNDAMAKLARYARYDDSEFEFDVSGIDTFWIVAEQSTFIEYLQGLQRTIGRNWNIVASDKLRVFENDATETPIAITRGDVDADTIQFSQKDPREVPAQRVLGFVNTDADNDFDKAKAVRARFPIALTASENTEEIDIPIGMAALQAKRAVNKSLLIDDVARDKVTFRALPHMRGLVPGDLIVPDFDDDIDFPLGRIVSVVRNSADWTSDIVAERINVTLLGTRTEITSNGGGDAASITVVEEAGVTVTTVTATNTDATGAFSIVGGADAALFTIGADTGFLEFVEEPDFEDPQDDDLDNRYEVVVQVVNDGFYDRQAITVTVASAAAGGAEGAPEFIMIF